MFYYETLFAKALAGIDGTSIITTVTTVAYMILAIGFLIGLYRAAMQGGDVQSALSSALVYLIVALIIANWSTAFRGVNDGFNRIADALSNSSGVGDMFMSWFSQLQQQSQTNPGLSLWDAITGDVSGVITALLLVVAYALFAIAMIIFCFFYTLYGTVLYVLGPLVLAFLPIAGANQVAKSYSVNLMIWNAWGILYAAFGALMTAIHVNRVNDVLGNGFVGFLRGAPDSVLLGIVSIFYALSIALIPVIATKIISGDVGSTAFSLVRSAGLVVSTAITAGAALAGGARGTGSSASGGGGGGGTGGGAAGAGKDGSGPNSASASSSPPPTPPAIPTPAQMLQSKISNAVNANMGSSGDQSSSNTPPPPSQPPRQSTPASA